MLDQRIIIPRGQQVPPGIQQQQIDRRPRLIVTGYGEHGKDTVCKILLALTGLTFVSSSWAMCEEVVYPQLKDKLDYRSPIECYENRRYQRKLWYDIIAEFNKDDLARLGKLIFAKYDVYCGLRNRDELLAMRELYLYDHLIWVDASEREEPEAMSSMTVTKEDADFILDNNGPEIELREKVLKLLSAIMPTGFPGRYKH